MDRTLLELREERRKRKKLDARVALLEDPSTLCIRLAQQRNLLVRTGHVCIKHGIRLELNTCVSLEDTTAGIHLL